MQSDYDAIVIGAGHNGLVCGAYLAQAGERVLVVERFDRPGGCVATTEIPGFPGSAVDIGGLEHGGFAHSHALRELALEEHGLRYLHRDHIYTFPVGDDACWAIHSDPQRSAASIARFSTSDAEAFMRFSDFAGALLKMLHAVSDAAPPDSAELARLAGLGGARASRVMQAFLASPRAVAEAWFESDAVRAGLINYATHGQTPPWQLGSGYAPCMAVGGQGSGGKRPEGGGAALIGALTSCLEQHGGKVATGQEVHRIIIRKGRAEGIRLRSGEEISAGRAVVSAIDARRVFTNLLDESLVPPAFRRRMLGLTTCRENIGELSMAGVLSELPRFSHEIVDNEAMAGVFWISGSAQEVERTFEDIRRGVMPERPCVMFAVPSVLDPSLAPPGKHVFWLAAFVPYTFRDGQHWDSIGDQTADLLLATVGRVAPNLPDAVLGRAVLTPVDWYRRTGNLNGNADHLDQSLDQMLGNRPSPGLAHYRTPIRGLYLTGAGTHPGGGITGASGRNTARVVLGDIGLGQKPSVRELPQRLARLGALAGAARTLSRYL